MLLQAPGDSLAAETRPAGTTVVGHLRELAKLPPQTPPRELSSPHCELNKIHSCAAAASHGPSDLPAPRHRRGTALGQEKTTSEQTLSVA